MYFLGEKVGIGRTNYFMFNPLRTIIKGCRKNGQKWAVRIFNPFLTFKSLLHVSSLLTFHHELLNIKYFLQVLSFLQPQEVKATMKKLTMILTQITEILGILHSMEMWLLMMWMMMTMIKSEFS